jgi:hypothetical protein
MLPHPDAVEEVALGTNGFLGHLRSNALWVDCSSVNPSFSKKMADAAAARWIRFVDTPVTGSAPVAAEAKLGLLGRRRRYGFGNDSLTVAVHGQQDCPSRWSRHGDIDENGDQSSAG